MDFDHRIHLALEPSDLLIAMGNMDLVQCVHLAFEPSDLLIAVGNMDFRQCVHLALESFNGSIPFRNDPIQLFYCLDSAGEFHIMKARNLSLLKLQFDPML